MPGNARYGNGHSTGRGIHSQPGEPWRLVSQGQKEGSMNDLAAFKTSLSSSTPPADLSPTALALWHDARGDWDMAHQLIQSLSTPQAAWIHAYLHRKEGDLANAAYWYRRAGQPVAQQSLTDEWEALLAHMLSIS